MNSRKNRYKNIPDIVLFPLLLWFMFSFVEILTDPMGKLPIFFFSKVNAIFGIFFTIIANYYISNEIKFYTKYTNVPRISKNFINITINIIFCLTALFTIISIFSLYSDMFMNI